MRYQLIVECECGRELRVSDSLDYKRTSPSGSASGALLPDPLAGQRQGDPLTSGSELALPDQAKGVVCGTCLVAGIGASRLQCLRPDCPSAPEAQSAAVESESCDCRAGYPLIDVKGRAVCCHCYRPMHGETEGASGSGNGAAVPPRGGKESEH